MPRQDVSDAPAEIEAAPGESAKEKAPKVERVDYMFSKEAKEAGDLADVATKVTRGKEEGEVHLLKQKPTAFDSKLHLKPKKADFEEAQSYLYFEFQADLHEKAAAKFRQKAVEEKDTEAKERRAKMKKLDKIKSQYEELLKTVAGEEGTSVEDLLKSLQED